MFIHSSRLALLKIPTPITARTTMNSSDRRKSTRPITDIQVRRASLGSLRAMTRATIPRMMPIGPNTTGGMMNRHDSSAIIPTPSAHGASFGFCAAAVPQSPAPW